MSIKNTTVRIAEKITGRKCCSCHYNVAGRCCHSDGNTFMRCWQSITRPGFEYARSIHIEGRHNEMERAEPGDLTEEEKYQMGKIVETLQEASDTAKDAGLLEDDEDDNWPQPW
jgi:hypothetical protein